MQINNTYKKYESYTVEELLQDEFFIESIIHPTPETDRFWMKAIEEEAINLYDYKLARYFVLSVQTPEETVKKEESINLWARIQETNNKEKAGKKKRFRLFITSLSGIAALLAVIIILNITPNSSDIKLAHNTGIENVTAPLSDATDIQLILADNKAISLDGKEADIAYSPEGIAINNEETQLSNNTTDNSVAYNQLIVPFGKRSMLTLAEGTKIWVNAGTRVVYPVVFSEKNREIYIDGEAYLDVMRDEEKPFFVKTKDMSIKVLGTSFNVMAYEKDTIQHIVLVEGSVQVKAVNNKDTILAPNEICQFVNGKQHIKTVDIDDYTSWKSGIYKYRSESLGIIIQRLSRYYGEEIDCSEMASRLTCSGKLDLNDDLKKVLRGIMHTAPVSYVYNGKTHKITNEQ